jgi:hypothetical protein
MTLEVDILDTNYIATVVVVVPAAHVKLRQKVASEDKAVSRSLCRLEINKSYWKKL